MTICECASSPQSEIDLKRTLPSLAGLGDERAFAGNTELRMSRSLLKVRENRVSLLRRVAFLPPFLCPFVLIREGSRVRRNCIVWIFPTRTLYSVHNIYPQVECFPLRHSRNLAQIPSNSAQFRIFSRSRQSIDRGK